MSVSADLEKNPPMAMPSFPRRLAPLFFLLALFLVFPPDQVSARAEIRDIVVGNSRDDLLLYLEVDKAFRAEMEEGILNGIPVLFTFFVSLREIVDGRPGPQVTEIQFNHALSYDSLKEAFKLGFSENNLVLTVDGFEKAQALMSEVNGVKVVALSRLQPGSRYFLSVKVRLTRKNLPLFFQYLIPFWQLGDEETDWQYVEFRY